MNSRRQIAAFLTSLASSQVFAQGNLEEILVTAQKREQNLQDVSISVSAFNAQQIENLGVEGALELVSVRFPMLISSIWEQ